MGIKDKGELGDDSGPTIGTFGTFFYSEKSERKFYISSADAKKNGGPKPPVYYRSIEIC